MNSSDHDIENLRVLVLKSQRETLSDSEANELNELIQTDAGAREAACLIDQLCSFSDSGALDSPAIKQVLAEVFQNAPSEESTIPADRPSRRRGAAKAPGAPPAKLRHAGSAGHLSDSGHRQWNRTFLCLAIVASHLLVASLAWSLAKPSEEKVLTAERTAELKSPQLIKMTACVWRQPVGTQTPKLGQSIRLGETLELVEGIAELQVGEGTIGEALVRIEGPAGLAIRADGQLDLRHGSLTVTAKGTGSGNVIVNFPVGEVSVDGQGSIGMVVNRLVNEVHLFSGRALVKPAPTIGVTRDTRLQAGEAVRFSSRSEDGISVVMFEATLARFVSARSSGFDPLALGSDYVKAVLDSKPNIYWRFENLDGEPPFAIKNQGSAPNMDAVLVGTPGWRQYGRNQVAELGRDADSSAFRSANLWPPKPLDEYTVELWAKPELYHHGEVICLHDPIAMDDGRHAHTMMLEATGQHHFTHRLGRSEPNRFRFVHRVLGDTQPISVTSLFAEQEYHARVWQHVVAQKEGDRQMLWIDGQLSAEHSNPVPLNKEVQILVGQVYPNSLYRRFVGQIDEVAIYDRCLSPDELRSHIRAAGAQSQSSTSL